MSGVTQKVQNIIGIYIEQPPDHMDAETREYLHRMLIQIAGALSEAESRIIELEKKVSP